MSRLEDQIRRIQQVLSDYPDDEVTQIDLIATIRNWFRPEAASPFYPIIQSYLAETIDLADTRQQLFTPIDQAIAARKLDDVKYLDLWYSVIHAARRQSFRHMEKQMQVVSLVTAFKTHSIPGNEAYDYLYDSLPDFTMACREVVNDAPSVAERPFDIEIMAWANVNMFFAQVTASGAQDLSLFAIWALRAALEDRTEGMSEEEEARSLDVHVPAAVMWIHGMGSALFLKEEDMTPSDPKQPDPARGGALWKGKSGFNNKRWQFWKRRLGEVAKDGRVTEGTRNHAKDALEEMERSETHDRMVN